METNKHGVIYSEIKVGDLVQIAFEGNLNDTCLGYVTKVTANRLWAIWSDDFEVYFEIFSRGNIIGHWKVLDFRKVPTKPFKQLVAYHSNAKGKIKWGVYESTDTDGKVWAYWEGWSSEKVSYRSMPLKSILQVEDIIIHEEKPKAFTFSDFDASVKRTWKDQDFKDAISNAALGLTGEAGEVADLIKKAVYHGRGFDYVAFDGIPASPNNEKAVKVKDVKDELSDILYYVSATAQEFGFTLEDVAKHNKEKLEKRFPEGFSTEASAQKADRTPVAFAKPYKTEFPSKFPFYARVIGDSTNNPTGSRHCLKIGSIVEVTRESACNPVKAFRADDMCVLKSDLEYIPKPEEATTLKISKSPFTDQQRLDVSTWYTWIPEGENWLEKIKELRVGETFESIDCHDTRHTFTKQPYGLVTMEYQELDREHEEIVGESGKIENIKVIEEVQK
ncbi:nucleoside triphosphate pyrophosphohydrolase family protein [Bacillus tropicus]